MGTIIHNIIGLAFQWRTFTFRFSGITSDAELDVPQVSLLTTTPVSLGAHCTCTCISIQLAVSMSEQGSNVRFNANPWNDGPSS